MEIEKIAKTVDIAIDEALKELNTTKDKISYEIMQHPSNGFLGMFKKPAKVLVKLKETKQNIVADKKEPKKNAIPKMVSEDEHSKKSETINKNAPDIAKKFLEQVFDKMKINISIKASINDKNNLIIDLSGDDIGVIIGKRGQTLDSLQYLINLIVNKGECAYMPIYLDTEDYRKRRKQALEILAVNLSKKVKKIGKNVVLEPMNPYERRIIHAKLQNNPDVKTYSEGEEPFRYVVISPKL